MERYTFLPLMENRWPRVVYAGFAFVRVGLAAAFVHALLRHSGGLIVF